MISTFFRHLLESMKSLKRNGWMTIASVSAVTITLTLVGIFLAIIMNTTKLADDVKSNVDVSVFIDVGTEQNEIDNLEYELRNLKNVETVIFSSKEDELQKLQSKFGDAFNLFDGDSNPLYDVFVVSANDPALTVEIAEEAAKLQHVFKADYGGVSSERILSLSNGVKTWGLAAAALLIFVAIFLISNTIRITILSRQREIQIMRLVGAKNGYIRWPFFLEGGWIGLFGAIIPVLIMIFGYRVAYDVINPNLVMLKYEMLAPAEFLLMISGFLVVIGMLIGSIGSVISMRRFLKI
ncbi:cell division transport system permease protein [Enterococcus sp. PF1-24]|uniref:permease-like cell division protein FtsX n=1 Tax=unclassified Enterococcus TaxID=2608891 RepID=UPI0024768827|nr:MULTISPECIES: permease-like cell division protein FtsX [unclassified Enterococcus]MDH6364733.1 cell division transport system permease protein [Enterococcus sp. PFB1-1]MDH6401791.1 cell division transport system permease protein [Enterococcus sp. PF1-24]